jgi:acetylornithine deacetylase/succinyl-diaminopimelate desuccinylase-like protein
VRIEHTLVERVLDLAITIQQIPAPTFSEARRARFVQDKFLEEGLVDVSIDSMGNVYGRLQGTGTAPALVISAHLDTVFPESTDLLVKHSSERIAAPGIGDNSLGVAGLFGLLWALRQRGVNLDCDVWLVANVGEEGLGDLNGMRAVVDRFGDQVQAYIILEGMALGQIYYRGLGVKRYCIRVQTQGGHSWVDHGRPSAVHELAKIIIHLNELSLVKKPRTTLNVGVIEGGTTVNTIASEAHLELDLRSEDAKTLGDLSSRVEELVDAANRPGVVVTDEVIGRRPAGEISLDHPLVQLAARCLQAQGISPRINIGSTDANIPLSRGLPAICIGLTVGSGAHTLDEYIFTPPLAQGLAQLISVVEQFNLQKID